MKLKDFKTVVFDSATTMELAARYREQFSLNPSAADPRQWYAGSTDQLEQMMFSWQASLRSNVVLLAHVDTQKDDVLGNMVYNPRFPGRLRASISANFGEVYHTLLTQTASGETLYRLQTRTVPPFYASSMIQAPQGCDMHYDAVWANWPKHLPKRPLHALVYGPAGSGKTTFCRTFPTPTLIFLFDSQDKSTPFLLDPRVARVENTVEQIAKKTSGFIEHSVDLYYGAQDELLFRVEHFQEEDLKSPLAWAKFQRRVMDLQ